MTDRYAVIGNPIAHSKSPLIHRMFAAQTGQDISYEAILAPLDGFAATVERLREEGYKGCNVTVPFKFEAFKLATELSKRAESAQAVNTLKFKDDAILGDNTDGAGLVADIEHNLGFTLHGKSVLLMGAGGAAYGVALPFITAGVQLTLANRTHSKAEEMARHFKVYGPVDVIKLDSVTDCPQFDCIINATSVGLMDDLPANLLQHENILADGALAYDMVYSRETSFMKFAREHGAAIVADGLGMLVEQAAEAFFIWRGVRPDTAPVLAALRNL